MLAHVVNKATSGTIAKAGWTIVGAQSNTASSRSALFYKFADAADVAASTFDFTLGTTGRNRGEIGAWLGVDTTTPINAVDQQINSAGTSIAVPTPTVTDGCTVLIIGSNALGGVASACSGTDPVCSIAYAVAYSSYCALACFYGVKSGTDAIDAHSTSTNTSAVSSGHAVALTPAAPPEEHSGSAAISGNGSLVGAVQKNGKGAATGSGNGSLTGLVQKGGKGSALTSGKGLLAAVGIAAMMGVASLSGGGTVATSGIAVNPQYAYPTSDVDNSGAWTTTPLYNKIDEEPYSDTDYVQSPQSAADKAFTVGLGSLTDPTVHTSHVLRIRALVGTSGTFKFELLQGATVIHDSGALSLTTSFAEYNFTLTEAEAANITDYTALRVRVTAVTTYTGKFQQVSWIRLEVPERIPCGFATISGNGTLITIGTKGRSSAVGVSGNGAVLPAGAKGAQDLVTISGNGTLATSKIKAASSIAAISGKGSVSTVGLKTGKNSVIISGNGSQITGGAKSSPTTIAISGGGSLVAIRAKQGFGSSTIAGGGILTATGYAGGEAYSGIALISGGGLLASLGEKSVGGAGSISANGALTGIGSKSSQGMAVISGGGLLTATGRKDWRLVLELTSGIKKVENLKSKIDKSIEKTSIIKKEMSFDSGLTRLLDRKSSLSEGD